MIIIKLLGLIGHPVSHSFSKKYFSQKFVREKIAGYEYQLFDLPNIEELPQLIEKNPHLIGLNVTIPHKQNVMPLLSAIDENAKAIGAVNVIKIDKNGFLKGFNSDYYGFKASLVNQIGEAKPNALILGTGGASKAVKVVLEHLDIAYRFVSRTAKNEDRLTYEQLNEEILENYHLIINTTPLGTSPNTEFCPNIPYEKLTSKHYLHDLVYNPAETLFMKKGKAKGANVKNGLEMLELQAEKSWEIWTK